jgi:subfamily B ATP-binding cassette protein MsbA
MAKKLITNKLELYIRILKYIRFYWGSFAIAMISNAIYASTDVYFVYLLKPILNKGFIARDTYFINFLPILISCIFILRCLASFAASYFMVRASRGVIMLFRQHIFKHLLQLPATYYDNHSSGKILSSILYNVEQVANAGADTLTIYLQSTCMVIGYIIIMFIMSWQLSMLFFITIPIIFITVRIASKRIRKINLKLQQQMGDVTNIAEEAIEGYKVIRAFGGQQYETNKFVTATKKNRAYELKVVVAKSLSVIIPQLVAVSILILTVYLATSHKSALMITAGGFASLVTAMLAMLKPLKNFTRVNAKIQRGLAGAESIFELLDQETEKDHGTIHIDRAKGAIAYHNVSFTYPNTNTQVLQNISFNAEAGQIIALVGQSGGGKTTIVNLLQRFYDDFCGDITIDNNNIRDFILTDLREQFAAVSQHVTLFNDTIAHNIGYGKFENASETEIIAAAKAANAWSFINQLPKGLNTLIGENGLLLSGGQRQRIAIARAILKNAPILILDEATSALDTESERQIQAALEKLMHNRTTLVIAHRLSTIENADKILVIEHGRVIEMGNHATLLAQNGRYTQLHKLQFSE